VIADANGRFGSIFLAPTPAYKIQLWTAPTVEIPTGTELWSEDPCGPGAGSGVGLSVGIVGEVRAFAGPASAIPSFWYACYGQAVSRTTYATAFAVLGTTWGAGDGSTTFNLPDLRGRGMFGKDNMGGVAASRITAGVSGLAGATLGAAGGSQLAQKDTITSTAATTSTVTETAHTHVQTIGQGAAGGVAGWNITATGTAGPSSLSTIGAKTGITVGSTTTVTSASGLTGTTQNIPPAAVMNFIIYLGA
jgi:microcystin-dependent protein